MGYTLVDDPNPQGEHFYRSRRGRVLAIVVHITAGLEDLDGHDDQSAEATARYAGSTARKVSWHSGSDTDSIVELLPADYTAWHVQGYNSITYGHEISKRHTEWRDMPADWVEATLQHTAYHLGHKALELSVPLRKTTRAELDDARRHGGDPVGFIGHWELDPGRRSDPGLVRGHDTFPWRTFIDLAAIAHVPKVSIPSRPTQPGGPRVAVTANMPVLSEGDTGRHVAHLQAALNVKAAQHLAVDGDFGALTGKAVRNWQAFFRLAVDGICGPATWKTLLELPL